MRRAAIYSRFSTDLQNDQSVEDQETICLAYAARIGCTVVSKFHDRARSGASLFLRDGLANLIASADAGGFDVLISEAPDRISRDMADLAGLHKRLEFRGIEINCVNSGKMDSLQIGVHGLVGQMQREEGAKKVRRGLIGVVNDGRHAGGRAFGYRPVLGRPGELEIVPEEAEVVRGIFRDYASGASPRTIAAGLNSEGVAPPRGSRWNASTINGNGSRGYGILLNPLYAGRNVWNRVRMMKDPATGKRVSRSNPESEWHTKELPHLRIVEQSTFDAVQVRKDSRGGPHGKHLPRAKRPLSGLLKCGCCGGGMTIIGSDRSGRRIQCSTYRESRSCTNAARYYVEKLERLVVDSLRHQLASPELISEYVAAYRDERRKIEGEARRGRAQAQTKLAGVEDRIRRLISMVGKGLVSEDEVAAEIGPLRIEKTRWQGVLDAAGDDTNVVELHPPAIEKFRANLEELAVLIADKNSLLDIDVTGTFHQLVESVIVNPRKAGEEYEVTIRGHLSSLLGAEVSAIVMVAGEGLEPPTPGL
ncbi:MULTISPECIES: recombinase family protein [unclassified Mesorhizobium]|uniref:recombinase family protein n=1 Tax=unclassified Mesorhizobium TaxID=325217 RepID=UPI001126A75B|nr:MULTISPECIES: recombinase family protein [unclassified Mesorhizobium]MBZ9699526.1 recombinase family protein [Mesorhizobium sp. CO1-1-3]MBZ9945779.1 recombinase family protein [Mesorhizobium sp. BR1-1-11]TPJ08346.1 recombinase family protein [Mesorhizobium sp. B2-8-1]